MVCLWIYEASTEYGIAALLPNVPQFLPNALNLVKRATFSREKHRNPWKSAAIQGTL